MILQGVLFTLVTHCKPPFKRKILHHIYCHIKNWQTPWTELEMIRHDEFSYATLKQTQNHRECNDLDHKNKQNKKLGNTVLPATKNIAWLGNHTFDFPTLKLSQTKFTGVKLSPLKSAYYLWKMTRNKWAQVQQKLTRVNYYWNRTSKLQTGAP